MKIETQKPDQGEKRMIHQLFTGAAANLVLVSVGILVAGLIDGIITGRLLGPEAMASYGLVNPVYLFLTCLSAIVSSGAQTYCGQLLGKGDLRTANRAFTSNCVTAVILSVAGTVVIMSMAPSFGRILGATGANAHLEQGVVDYLYGFAPAFVLIVFVTMLNSFMFLEGDKRRAWMAMFVSSAVNVAGDLLNVYVFKKGLFGMAAATSVSYVFAMAIMLLHWRHAHILHLDFKDFSFGPMKRIVPLGLPVAVNKLCNFFRSFALNRLISLLAIPIALTAFSIRNNLNNLYGAVGTGIAHAVLLLGAVYTGDEDKTSIRILFSVALRYGLLFTTTVSAAVIVFADPIVAIYLPGRQGTDVFSMTVLSLRLYMVSVPFYMIAQIYMNLFQAMGKTVLTMIVCILDNFACVTAWSYILGWSVGINGVWISFLLGEIATLLFILVVIIKRCGHFPRCIDDLILFEKGFDESPKERFRVSAESLDGIMAISEEVYTFLTEQGADRRTAYVCSLSVEELGKNIVEWGFEGCRKPVISIYVYYKQDAWTLRIRDNCRPFNPRKWLEGIQADHEDGKLGIRMIMGMVQDVNYVNALKINNLVLRISEKNPAGEGSLSHMGESNVFHKTA